MKKSGTFGAKINDIYSEWNRAAGIVVNDKKEIILRNLTNMYFHMLPGGGINFKKASLSIECRGYIDTRTTMSRILK